MSQPSIVLLASTPWSGPQLSDQRLARALARRVPVLYVEPPVRVWARDGGWRWPTFRLQDALDSQPRLLTTTALPGDRFRLVERGNAALLRFQLRQALPREFAQHWLITTGQSSEIALRGRAVRRTFWLKDDYQAGASLVGLPASTLARRLAEASAHADDMLVASELIANRHPRPDGRIAVMHPGCDTDVFRLPSTPTRRQPAAVYAGHISDRVDFTLLHRLADAGVRLELFGGVQFSFTGERTFQELLRKGSVRWHGVATPSVLAPHLAEATVGLVPYRLTSFNEASWPLKFYEYLGCGLAVVSTALPTASALASEDVVIAGGQDFVSAVQRLAAEVPHSEAVRRRVLLAEANSWDERARWLLHHQWPVRGGHRSAESAS